MAPAIIEAAPLPAVDRKFWAILGFSAALHGALLVSVSWERQPQSITLPPITATIRLLNTIESRPLAEAPVAQPAVSEKVRPQPPRAERPAPPMVTRAGPAIVPAPVARPESRVVAAPPPAPVASAMPLVVPAEAMPSPAPVAERPLSTAPVAPASGPANRETLDRYRMHLTELFAGRHEYPRVAAMRGWEGEVRLRLKVARKGNLLGVVLDRSSGFDVLDRHALAMIEAFGALPPLPDALDSNEIQVVVPISYKLRKAT